MYLIVSFSSRGAMLTSPSLQKHNSTPFPHRTRRPRGKNDAQNQRAIEEAGGDGRTAGGDAPEDGRDRGRAPDEDRAREDPRRGRGADPAGAREPRPHTAEGAARGRRAARYRPEGRRRRWQASRGGIVELPEGRREAAEHRVHREFGGGGHILGQDGCGHRREVHRGESLLSGGGGCTIDAYPFFPARAHPSPLCFARHPIDEY